MCTLSDNPEDGFGQEMVKHTSMFCARFPGERAANVLVPRIAAEPSRARAASSPGPAVDGTRGKLDKSQKPSNTENTPNALHTPKPICVQVGRGG